MTTNNPKRRRSFAALYRAESDGALRRRDDQRALVLAYPDIAAKLRERPLHLARPEQWTGYIPGPLDPEGDHGRVRLNTSPVRAQLVAILTEAAERADTEARGRRAA